MSYILHIKYCKQFNLNQHYVYLHKTNENITFYVGKGQNDRAISLIDRSKQHKSIREKYGFNIEIIYRTYDEDDAYLKEVEMIEFYHTWMNDPQRVEHCCNKNKGGKGKNSSSGWNPSKETREKMSMSAKTRPPISEKTREKMRNHMLGKVRSQDYCNNISLSKMGDKNPSRIHPCSDATKEKLKLINSRPDVKQKRSLAKSIKVYQFDMQGNFIAEFTSAALASRILKINSSNITQCCRKNKNYSHAGGFRWQYTNEIDD